MFQSIGDVVDESSPKENSDTLRDCVESTAVLSGDMVDTLVEGVVDTAVVVACNLV